MVNSSRRVRIVLVRPRNPLNLLAAARAAANFGFDDVVVVSPYAPTWEEAGAARGAGKWLRRARRVASLIEAIADRNWVLGTSCLARRQLPTERVLSLDQVATRAAKARDRDQVAILFGSEKRGLSNQELELCHAVIRIPTAPATPSINLGQAVAVCCYELRRWCQPRRVAKSFAPPLASVGEIARLVEELRRVLPIVAANAGKEKKRQQRLRQMLLRLPLTSQDVTLLMGLLRDLAWRLGQTV
ncbi:MAG: RNA methyltransferase [Acidobacteria bacterium]|nr:RNA methyltransferase [Acidobacteriota bacterium]